MKISTSSMAEYIGPMEVPQTPTDVILGDCWLTEVQLVCETVEGAASPVVVSVKDLNSPAGSLVPRTNMYPGSMISGDSNPGRLMPGGVRWSASGPGVTGYIIYRR